MRTKRFVSKRELSEFLVGLATRPDANVVVQGGHFALIEDYKKQELVPAIYQDIETAGIKESVESNSYMAEFPLETWKLSLDLCRVIEKNIQISIIVNDWQWIPKALSGERNELREHFYKYKDVLPPSFYSELINHKLDEDYLFRDRNKNFGFLIGEQKLRKIASRKFKYSFDESFPKSCAYGYVPFLDLLKDNDINLLISFIPKTCQIPINYGTILFCEEMENSLKVLNVFFNGIYRKDFYEDTEITMFNI